MFLVYRLLQLLNMQCNFIIQLLQYTTTAKFHYIIYFMCFQLPAYFARAEIFFPTLFQVLKSFSNKEEITTIKEMVNEILIAKLKPITNSNVSEKSVTIELSIPEPIGSNVMLKANNKKLHFKNLNNLLQPWLINKYFPLVHQVAINYGFMSMYETVKIYSQYEENIINLINS